MTLTIMTNRKCNKEQKKFIKIIKKDIAKSCGVKKRILFTRKNPENDFYSLYVKRWNEKLKRIQNTFFLGREDGEIEWIPEYMQNPAPVERCDALDSLLQATHLRPAPPDNIYPATLKGKWNMAYRNYIASMSKRIPIRTCYSCGETILFEEFWRANKTKDLRWLKKIWKSKYVQLYCCSCYKVQCNKEENIFAREDNQG